MKKGQKQYERVYNALKKRLNMTGEITTNTAWRICGGNYSTVASVFSDIMLDMVRERKARILGNGKYLITIANTLKEKQ